MSWLKALAILFISFGMALFENFSFADQIIKSTNGVEYHTGLLGHSPGFGAVHFKLKSLEFAPSLDLRPIMPAVRNQGSCGSCWSFAITRALESARIKSGSTDLNLSEQQQVSCNTEAYGCSGGFMSSADYAVNPGLALESDYPYTATDSRCKRPMPAVADKLASWAYVGQPGRGATKDELKAALNTYGPLFVTVSAGGTDWNGSRIHMTGCRNRGTNHMVVLAGYNEQDEFLISNSWGSDWGDGGYAWAKLGCNVLASEVEGAAFVVYEGTPAVPPKVRLASEITIQQGTEIMLGVRPENGVTYLWSTGETSSMIYVSPTVETIYTLKATNRAGEASSSVKVKIQAPGIFSK